MKNQRIAVIGAGHMAGAMIGGMVRSKLLAPKNIIAARRSPDALAELQRKWGVKTSTDNKKAACEADIVILAVKPQMAKKVLEELSGSIRADQLVISVMAGVTTAAINAGLRVPCPVVRAMPNTPCLVDAGATAICAGEHAEDKDLAKAEAVFGAVGLVVTLPESALDAVTGLSGSGPVYIYMAIEAMIDGGVKMGIPRAIAAKLAAQTVYGAAKLVIETGKHPAVLKDEVTTPGGTAITAIHVLESKGLRSVLIDGVEAATKRSTELSKLFAQ
ncbi:MAG: pyrroline-5-carboxylate reductase [Elusimicrobia bacterium RBG_16_66_12]|nr:MAG: pyrroline-5-carboxylate reductase [Elusimicrobia bacterium RBG_16_66_12]